REREAAEEVWHAVSVYRLGVSGSAAPGRATHAHVIATSTLLKWLRSPGEGSRCSRRGSLLGGALGTGAEQLDGVLHAGEPVLGAHPRGPVLHSGRIQLHCGPALPADQVVMVVAGEALAVQRLAVGR